MIDAVGGYFELELQKGKHYHPQALRLNTGRNCFEYLLRARKYAHVYIPYYTCEVMLEPLHKLSIPFTFYSLDHLLEPASLPELKPKEAFVYTNYYGLKQQCVEQLANHFGQQLIVDNSQAFFAPHIARIDTFYTARKFFGVPDGAYLYTDAHLDIELPRDESIERISHLLKRIEYCAEDGYADYQEHEEELCNQSIKRMSCLTERILESIDYKAIAQKRRNNYLLLQNALYKNNKLKSQMIGNAVPMVYPYWTRNGAAIRKHLQQKRFYTATYWSNVKKMDCFEIETNMAENIIPIPCDQRYEKTDMDRIIKIIKDF